MRFFYVLAGVYAVLGAAAAFYTFYKGAYDAAHSEFAGLPLLILALPWSWLLRHFNPHLLADQYNSNIIMQCAFVAFNTLILLVIGRVISIRTRKGLATNT